MTELLRRYAASPDATVVDVGCGTSPYRDVIPGTYIGVDRHGEVDVIADADSLPFDDESVDLVFCVSAFYQFSDADRVLREFARVLRPGGRVLLADYNRRMQRRLARSEGSPRPGTTAFALRARVRRAGFEGAHLLTPEDEQPTGLRRLTRVLSEELSGQWAVVTAKKR